MAENGARIYIWLEGEPGVSPPSVSIPDEPGVNDLDQLGWAIARGDLGRYLPVTLKFATHSEPSAKALRSVDVARLLRERNIRHRRRYEVFFPTAGSEEVE